MAYLRFGLVAVNVLAFIVLFVLTIRFMNRERSVRVRRLWIVVALAAAALIVGSLQRLALQATALGWLPRSVADDVVEGWQFVQSLVVLGLAIVGFLTVKSLTTSMAVSEKVAGSILDRVDHVEMDRLQLTKREHEVLMAIGSGTFTDAELAQKLHISTSTVQTHVKHLLSKTGLNRRQDLMAVAYLLESNIF
ncbi:MAG TPA: helix-turn-helix transcriptional regulator [Acidimicrobiia bacterium]|nr:helix-turn-helix transcriptional regulator [Acidimicrobiia bacterium]